MKLEPKKFYKHEKGRAIAVLGIVKTYKWGDMLVIEETDPTGHSMSCVAKDSEDLHDRWVEIGEAEFMDLFHSGLMLSIQEE